MTFFDIIICIFLSIGVVGFIYECIATVHSILRFIRREIYIRGAMNVARTVLKR